MVKQNTMERSLQGSVQSIAAVVTSGIFQTDLLTKSAAGAKRIKIGQWDVLDQKHENSYDFYRQSTFNSPLKLPSALKSLFKVGDPHVTHHHASYDAEAAVFQLKQTCDTVGTPCDGQMATDSWVTLQKHPTVPL